MVVKRKKRAPRRGKPRRRAAVRARGAHRGGARGARRKRAKKAARSRASSASAATGVRQISASLPPAMAGMLPRTDQLEEEFDRILREEADDDADYFDEE